MKRSLFIFATLLVASLCLALTASAQQGVISIDNVEGQGSYTGDTLAAGENIRFVLRYLNNTGEKVNISNGWKISSPDGADWDSVTMDSAGPITIDAENRFILYFNQVYSYQSGTITGGDGTNPDTVGVLGAGNPGTATRQMPNNYNDTAMAVRVWFNGNVVDNNRKHICIDTSFWGVGGTWVWVGASLAEYFPTFVGLSGQTYNAGTGPDRIGSGYCFFLYDPTPVGVDEVDGGTLPKEFSISQNYPNPFNPTTKIDFEVPRRAQVNLSVYNVLGQKVATLVDQEMAPGKYVADWDGNSDGGAAVASGIYFYKFEAGNFVQTKKMVMMK